MDPSKNAPPDHPFGGTVSMADPLGSTISMAESPVRSSLPSAAVVANASPSEARPVTGSQPIGGPAPITGEHGIARASAPSSPFPASFSAQGAPGGPFPMGIVPPSGAVSIERPSLPQEHEVSIEIPPPAELEPPSQRPPEAKDPYLGTTFDHRYKIEEVIGEGGMGVVYRARHKIIAKKVAVKVLRADMARDKEILERFLQEARAASSIGNAHIVDISDFGELPDGSTYIVMEFLEGKSIAAMFEGGKRMPVQRICHIAAQIADGLAAAHGRGIIHRDLKPDNIFLVKRGHQNHFVKVLDFGIAKVGGANSKLTKTGMVFGTPYYMSPEQAAGQTIDARTDIYALGIIMYEMFTGQVPFDGDTFMGILSKHMFEAPVPIRASAWRPPSCPPSPSSCAVSPSAPRIATRRCVSCPRISSSRAEGRSPAR
jgi:tRNA A-37 threonylcarbamoyl transferase component Bud32